MSEQEIIEGNKLIAMRIGWTEQEFNTYITLKGVWGKLAFHEKWDLLMPVIEKIEALETDKNNGEEFQFSITGDGIAITKFDDGSGIIATRVNEIGKSKLQPSWWVVVEFFQWYNQQPHE